MRFLYKTVFIVTVFLICFMSAITLCADHSQDEDFWYIDAVDEDESGSVGFIEAVNILFGLGLGIFCGFIIYGLVRDKLEQVIKRFFSGDED